MNCKLIVNRNGLLSACPTEGEFKAGNYFVDPAKMVVESAVVHPSTYKHLYENRDRVFVLHPELPERTDDGERIYYEFNGGFLKRFK